MKFVSDLRQLGGFLRILPVSSTHKTDSHDIIEILLNVALNIKTLTLLKGLWSEVNYLNFLNLLNLQTSQSLQFSRGSFHTFNILTRSLSFLVISFCLLIWLV